ncbi:MAG: Carbohydrate kinase [Gemmatimonadetes bacterium]|nr:Carbohydrate kinase [Gemmatimonadota bacterium]
MSPATAHASLPSERADVRHNYLAIDLGASSGRAVVGTLDDATMQMQEVHRFSTPVVEAHGHISWDIEALWAEIRESVRRAFSVEGGLRSVSVDSWAVDYVPVGGDGNALRNPFCYRDPRIHGCFDTAIHVAGGADSLYDLTGTQFLPFNTLPQVIADLRDEADVVRATATRLFIAEYFLYRLSGSMIAEATMASTSQLVDARTGQWSSALIAAIGDEARRWPRIVQCGAVLGPMLPDLMPEPSREAPVVIACCTHDTAAAVAAVPAVPVSSTRPWAFISSGTWSLVGTEMRKPMLSHAARAAGFTNEAGLDGTTRFLVNRAGMFVLEECRREWGSGGASLESMISAAAAAESVGTIDLNEARFAARSDMVQKIRTACFDAGIRAPETTGEIIRLILDSLAESHAVALDRLDALTGRRTEDVHIVGGGSQNDLLNQLTADRSGRRVLAGPAEATILGNLLSQARSLGDLPAGVSIRDAARRSSRITAFISRRGVHVPATLAR